MNITQTYTGHLKHRYRSLIAYPAEEMSEDVIVEIGPGRGDFLFHLAGIHPKKTICAVEIKAKRFHKLIERRNRQKLTNIKLILADAAVALPELFEKISVESIFINFPDPWPKKRHAKNRLLKYPFLKICSKILKPGGTLFITTDAEWYSEEIYNHCIEIPELKSIYGRPAAESDEAYPTLFSEKWKSEGRTIYYQKYVKRVDV